MNVLVTGGAGYVGSVLVPTLLAKGHKVRVLDTLMYGIDSLLGCFNDKKFEFKEVDITNAEAYKAETDDIDIVIHLAAIVGYPACKQDEYLARQVNVVGSRVVVENTYKNIPIIFASTGSVYGKIGDVCSEEIEINPLTIYGETKALAEDEFTKRGNSIIFRFATCFGISPRMRLDLMINDFVFKAIKERNLIIYEKNFKRSFIHITDMVRSFIFAIENYEKLKEKIFNVGDERMNCTKEFIAEYIKEQYPYYLHYADIGQHDEDKRDYQVSYSKIKKAGFSTQISLKHGINKLIKLFKYFNLKNKYSNA